MMQMKFKTFKRKVLVFIFIYPPFFSRLEATPTLNVPVYNYTISLCIKQSNINKKAIIFIDIKRTKILKIIHTEKVLTNR